VQSARAVDLQGYIRAWLASGPQARADLRIQVDVDPQSFL
jgi:primosomal protein N' (replication factor Y)